MISIGSNDLPVRPNFRAMYDALQTPFDHHPRAVSCAIPAVVLKFIPGTTRTVVPSDVVMTKMSASTIIKGTIIHHNDRCKMSYES
jgi:hypothetical protein